MNDAVCPSIRHTFFTMFSSSYRHEKFSVVITINKSDVSAKGQGQRSKVKVTGQKNFDPIWTILDRDWSLNHRWLRYNAQSLKWHSRSALLFVKVIQQISSMVTQTGGKSTILTQIECFQTVSLLSIHRCLQNYAQSLKWHRRGALLFFKVACEISRSHRLKCQWFGSALNVSGW